MAGQKIFIGARNKNGQFGYISEGYSVPEFISFIKPQSNINVLVDFSPVIEKLHELHNSASNEEILKDFNAMFNLWQLSRSLTVESVRVSKCGTLVEKANDLINGLHIKLQKSENDFYAEERSTQYGVNRMVLPIKQDSNIYIDTLLCFIHSMALLDIESFKNDTVLTSYVKFLKDYLSKIYRWLLRSGEYSESFLKFLALEHPERMDLQQYLDLEGKGESEVQFRLRIQDEARPYTAQDQNGNYRRESAIRYDGFNPYFLQTVEIFKDLLYKIKSVSDFLELLKAGSLKWDATTSAVDELRESIIKIK